MWIAISFVVEGDVCAHALKHIVCYQHEDENGELGDQINIGEVMIPVEQWREGKELIVCDFSPVGEDWTWYKRSDEGLFIIITSQGIEAEALKTGTDMMLEVYCFNAQTAEEESSTITINLPTMTMQEGHK